MASDKECYEKALLRGQRTFTLVGQDLSSPGVICEWIKVNIETAPADKLFDALQAALVMRGQGGRKVAD